MGRARRRGDEQGSVIVETALVLPVALAVLLAIFTGGTAYYQKIGLVDAARDAARYGATLKVPTTGIDDWRQAVRNRVADLSGGEVEADDVCADLIVPTGTDTTCGVDDPAGAASDPTVDSPASIVKVAVGKATRLEFIFFSTTPTVTAKVAARYERDST